MSAWTEDRDVGTMPSDRVARCNYTHELVGFCMKCGWTIDANAVNETVRELRRLVACLGGELKMVREDLATRDQQLTEARMETRRVEEKLTFTQRALDLHEQSCEKQVCNCNRGNEFICYVHGKAGRS